MGHYLLFLPENSMNPILRFRNSLPNTKRLATLIVSLRVCMIVAATLVAATANARTIYYHGVVAAPEMDYEKPNYGNTPGGLTFSGDCFGLNDPSANDGFPGCLGLLGNAKYAPVQFGAFSLEKPVTVSEEKRDLRHLPRSVNQGKAVIPFVDPSVDDAGQSIYKRLSESAKGWTNREMTGLAALRDGSVLHTCARDWYNVGQKVFPSHCLTDSIGTDKAVAKGPHLFRCPAGYGNLCHTEMLGAYVGSISDQAYADKVFASTGFSQPGAEICLMGDMRSYGIKSSRSLGFALYAFRCDDLKQPGSKAIDALPLMHHPFDEYNTEDNYTPEKVKWPQYSSKYKWSPRSRCYDISWGKMPVAGDSGKYESGLFVACGLGGQIWWYGTSDPWNDPNSYRGFGKRGIEKCLFNENNPKTTSGANCKKMFESRGEPIPPNFTNPCNISKGFHGVFPEAPYRRSVLLFYRGDDIAKSANLTLTQRGQDHLSNVPFEVVLDMPQQLWETECGGFNGVSFDPDSNRLFLMEDSTYTPVIHVFSM